MSIVKNDLAEIGTDQNGDQTGGASEETTAATTSTSTSTSGKKSRKAASAFRTISEVAEILDVQQHVLRFWETKFTQVKPLKRGGGRRYYRPEDVEVLKRIHTLLYSEGYTIKGVQKLLKGQGKTQIIESPLGVTPMTKVIEQATEAEQAAEAATVAGQKAQQSAQGMSSRQKAILKSMLGELKELRDMIKSG